MLKIKQQYKSKVPYLSFNILRFPSFMSIVTLPKHIREKQGKILIDWLDKNKDFIYLDQFEKDGIIRLIAYINDVEVGHSHTSSIESRERDFKSFFTQYDHRRGKDFYTTFADHPELLEWYDNIPLTDTQPLVQFKNGDSSGYTDVLSVELKLKAEKEGWVLDPKSQNPGSKDFPN
jgi:hypothetical protein